MNRPTAREVDAVRAALTRSHATLTAFARNIPPDDRTRRSYCTEWSVAQVYSHLGSGAEIEAARLRAALGVGSPPDPPQIWNRWDALSPAEMIAGFASADGQYLQLIGELDIDKVGDLPVTMDSLHVPLATALVLRLTEHALHSWDVYVTFDPETEVASDASELLVDLYPREIISMVASLQIADRFGSASLRIDIATPERTMLLNFEDSVTLEAAGDDVGPALTGYLTLPNAGVWARLLTGRLDEDHTPSGVVSIGRPSLEDLKSALRGDPFPTADAESPS